MFTNKAIQIYKQIVGNRFDAQPELFYFSHTDFDGLEAKPFEFDGANGQRLCGNLYYYEKRRTDRLIIFEHGMGGGHRPYMREIELLARQGYTVAAYDHTGCESSAGNNVGGFAQSLSDLDYCIRHFKSDDEYGRASLSVVGHSWGGYSTLNIGAIHPDITHIVVLSGFLSVRRILEQFFGSYFLREVIPYIYDLERRANPKYVEYDAIKSLHKTKVKALLIYSDDDKSVKRKNHYDRLFAACSDRPDTYFILEHKKGHNPNYTKKAVKLLALLSKERAKARKKGALASDESKKAFRESFDWWKITEQDMNVWNEIFRHLEK